MSLAAGRPTLARVRGTYLAIFVAFMTLFGAYVDLFLLLDDRTFSQAPLGFWDAYTLTFLAFTGTLVAILACALYLSFISTARRAYESRLNAYSPLVVLSALALLSLASWVIFFTIHGFLISIVAVLSLFALLLSALFQAWQSPIIVARAKRQSVYRWAWLTTLLMLTVVMLTAHCYTTLDRVAPSLFSRNATEFSIVIAIMALATLFATACLVHAYLLGYDS